MLDDHDRDPGLVDASHDLDGPIDFGRVEPGERLVEQQHLWTGGDRPRHLQQLAFVEVDLGGVGVGAAGEADEVEVRLSGRSRWGDRRGARPNMIAMATLSRTVIDANGCGIW